jgi:Metallo-beta-lactamase superfamily
MKQIRIGDIIIDAVIEREGPWRRPQDFFPAYDEAVFKRHLPSMEPEVFDPALGMMVITYQTFVVRTPHHTILVDTCTGENKGHPPPFDFPGKERWRNELFALGIAYDEVDYVFCTHLHIDHTGWNTTLRDGRWVPTFPNAKYVFHKKCGLGSRARARGQSARHGIPGQLPAHRGSRTGASGRRRLRAGRYHYVDADAGAFAVSLLRQHFLPRAARGRDRRHDASHHTVPGA